MSRALVHHLHAARPRAPGELALRLELRELGLVVGIGDRTGAQAIADGKRDVIGRQDLADVVPAGVEEVLLMVGEAPFGEDRAAAGNNAGHAPRGQRDETQEDAGVDREVVDALLALLDQRVPKEVPGELLGPAAGLFQRLVDRDGADRHRGVADDPLARLVNVPAGRQVHDRVGAPADGPAHLLDLLLDRGGDGAVAEVGVEFHEEVAADDHRLEFRVVDIGRDDGAAASDLAAHEFRRDFARDGGAKSLAGMLVLQ